MQPGQRGDTAPRPDAEARPGLGLTSSVEREAPPDLVLVEPEPRAPTRWQVGAATAIALGIVARFAARSHLWLDETLSVNIARLPLGELFEALRHDGAPPLYYVLLHGWIDLVGDGTIAVRALSGIFSVAALPLMWVAGKRIGGARMGLAAVLLLAASPFAVRYATEARMYSLVVVLALIAWLALDDLLRRFSWPSALALALATGLLLLTQYWSFYLLAVTLAVLGHRARRGPGKSEALKALGAVAAGCALFLPWVPSFVYQLRNTGTPWGAAPTLRAVFDTAFQFAGGFWDPGFVLGLMFCGLIVLALFGHPMDGHRIELDLRTRRAAWPLVIAGFGTLVLAVVAGMVTRSAFAVRYASVLFPFVLLLVALGTSALAHPRVFRSVVAITVVLGFVAIFPNVVGERTNAARVASVLRVEATPGDVVTYCPDQLGPSVTRMLPAGNGLVHLTFPSAGSPELIDWVGYGERNKASQTGPFSEMLLERAGPERTIWVVWAPGYRTLGTKCELLIDRLTKVRPNMDRVVKLSKKAFEKPGLVRFRPG